MVVAYIIVLIPILMVFFLFLGNVDKTSELNQKRKILEEIHLFNKKNTTVTNFETTLTTSLSINDRSSLQNGIINIAGQIPISTENISVLSFNTTKTFNNLAELKGRVKF